MANETKEELKNTINLPKTTLEMRANAIVKEPQTQKFWEDNKIYDKMLENKDKTNKFILHDGPPYLSSEKIHVGTALNKILKDIIIKYKTQRGFYSPYVPGYDAHGLPIENAVVKTLEGGRHSITEGELRQKCREYASKSLKGQEAAFKRLGVLGNWDNPYLTIRPEYEAQQIRVFGEMYKKGYIEKGLKPVYWCASCETALAEAEVEYEDVSSASIYVRFEFDEESTKKINGLIDLGGKKIFAVIWTTTPWTIPSNVAISMHPRFEYTFFERKGEVYIVATDLLSAFLADTGIEQTEIKVIGTAKGQDFELLNVKHPLIERKSKIILGEHVTLDAGTGLVHTAPGHGLEDWEVGCKYGIEILSPLDSKGCWTEEGRIPELVGVPYYKGNSMVIEMLEKANALVSQNEITHSYPHCWRCKHPVIYRATPQWFVKVDKFRDKALEAIKKVKWIPASGENRIGNMVEGRTDWCISRQRAWGVPIPVFYCEDCGEVICTPETINNVAQIFEKESSDAWVNHSVEELLPQGFKCPKCGKTHFRKEKDIKGKEELIAIKYDPQGNVISRKKADNVDEYDLNDANEDGEVNEFYNADVNYDPEKYYEVNEENERKYNNIKNMNNMNNFMNNNIVTVSNNQVIYETAAPQEIVYEAPAIYDQNVTVNEPIHETIISHDPNISDTAYNDIISNTINGLNKGNNLENYNNPFNNLNINDVNYSQINNHSSTYQNYGMNNYNIGNSNIYSQASYNNNINFDGAGISNNNFNNIQYPY